MMTFNHPSSFFDATKILFSIKSHLQEIDIHLLNQDSHAAMTSMKNAVKLFNSIYEKQYADKTVREIVEPIKEKFKEMQNKLGSAEIVIMHVAFLQQIGLYDESHYHLEKMQTHNNAQASRNLTDAQALQTFDLLAKIYLRNGAIPGARTAASNALTNDPNNATALMILAICRRADAYNEQAKPGEKTWMKPFAYLTREDVAVFAFLGIKKEDLPPHLRAIEKEPNNPVPINKAARERSFANTSFSLLPTMRQPAYLRPIKSVTFKRS